jgi:hypothetical protein
LLNFFNNLVTGATNPASTVSVFGAPKSGQKQGVGTNNTQVNLTNPAPIVLVYKNAQGGVVFAQVDQPVPTAPKSGETRTVSEPATSALDVNTGSNVNLAMQDDQGNNALSVVTFVNVTIGAQSFASDAGVEQVYVTGRGLTMDTQSAAAQGKLSSLTGGELVELDLVIIDAQGNMLSDDAATAGGQQVINEVDVEMPVSNDAIDTALGLDPTTTAEQKATELKNGFESFLFAIFMAPTVADYENGDVEEVAWDSAKFDVKVNANGKVQVKFKTKHFSVFGVGEASEPRATDTTTTDTDTATTTSSGGSGGGCTIGHDSTRDATLVLLFLAGVAILTRRRMRSSQQR